MITPIIILSAIFVGIAFLINKDNAKDLLSGYNTMTIEERQNFDIESYILYFKKFHLFLAISLFTVATLLLYFVNADLSGIFMGIYPIIAYTLLIWKSNQFYFKKIKKQRIISYVAILAMLILAGFIAFQFHNSLQNNDIKIVNNRLEITGEYGFEININNVTSISLVNKLPEITSKISGFGFEVVKKGYFRTAKNEKIKLLINSNNLPMLLITTTDHRKIYYAAKEQSSKQLYNELRNSSSRKYIFK